MRVVIDRDRCSGHGRCYTLASALFVDDDAGYGLTIADGSVGAELVADARRAATACPERAVRIVDDDAG
jgi:ferredoxin